jgi:hypothetical protein
VRANKKSSRHRTPWVQNNFRGFKEENVLEKELGYASFLFGK